MSNIEQLIRELRMDINRDSEESLKKLETRITKNINEHTDRKFTAIQGEIDSIKKNSADQDKRILELEKHIRYRNILFFAVDEGEKTYEELEIKILRIVTNDMNTTCTKHELEMVKRMGRKSENKIRPIVATFTTYGTKIAILKNKHFLKEKSIYVKEDYPQQILEKRKELQDQMQKERNDGKIAFLRYDRLIVRDPNIYDKTEKEPKLRANSKKRELEITPPNQKENQYVPRDSALSPKYQAVAKKTKVKKTNNKGQNSMTNFLLKHNDSPRYNTALSSDESVG